MTTNAFNRRSVLAAAGAAVTTSLVPTTVQGQQSVPVVRLEGSLDNPVTQAEAEKARTEVRETYGPDFGVDFQSGRPGAETEGIDNPMVAYVFGLDPNGVPQVHSQHANTERSRRQAIEEAREAAQSLREQHRNATTDDLQQAQLSTTSGESWNYEFGNYKQNSEDPYGTTANGFSVWKLQNDGKSDEDAFALQHRHYGEEGASAFDSLWYYTKASQRHDWDYGNADYVADLGPDENYSTGGSSQDINVDLTIGDASESWTATLDSDTDWNNNSDTGNGIAKWDNPTVGVSDFHVTPGSCAFVPIKDDGKRYFVRQTSSNTFLSSCGPYCTTTEDVTFTWRLYWEY